MKFLFSFAVVAFVCVNAFAQQPQLVKDFNTRPADYVDAANQALFAAGNHGFFPSKFLSFNEGSQWWVTDGTPAGTHPVNNNPEGEELTFDDGWAFGDSFLYIDEIDGTTERLLKYTPSTSTVTVIKQFDPGYAVYKIRSDDQLMLGVSGPDDTQLWISDGTTDGTVKFTTLDFGYAEITHAEAGGTYTYFTTMEGDGTQFLWKTDGTEAGTISLLSSKSVFDNYNSFYGDFFATGNILYFYFTQYPSNEYQFWRTDGTVAGTTKLTTLSGQPQGPTIHQLGDKIIFGSSDKLYVTDGTVAGTQIFLNGAGAEWATIYNGQYYFISYRYYGVTNTYDYLLMRTDGTVGGTATITGPGISKIQSAALFNDKLLLSMMVDGMGQELGIVDATGTISLVKDIFPGAPSSNVTQITPFGSKALFIANEGIHGLEPWVTDGTPEGTMLIRDMKPGTENGFVGLTDVFTTATPNQYVVIAKESSTFDLWTTDGTDANTKKVYTPEASPNWIGQLNGDPYFVDAGKIIKVNAAGEAVIVKDLDIYLSGFSVNNSKIDNKLLFEGRSIDSNTEPWVTDGTEEGTHIIKDIAPGNVQGFIDSGLAAFGKVFFVGNDVVHGNEIWTTDGTEAGTSMLVDLTPGGSSVLNNFVFLNNKVYFFRHDPTEGKQIWSTDGTEAGTQLLIDLPFSNKAYVLEPTIFEGNFFFGVEPPELMPELWKSDGTTNGTVKVKAFDNVDGSGLWPVFVVGDTGFFFASDKVHGKELWVTDGTENGTNIIEINPGVKGLTLNSVIGDFHGLFYFATNDAIWRTAGTSATTEKVVDVTLTQSRIIGDKMFLGLNTEEYGIELFTLPFVKMNQSVFFEPITDKTEDDPAFSISASATTGMTVTFTASPSNKVTIIDKSVSLVNPGSVTITAMQAGSEGIESAEQSQTICINPAKPTITLKQDKGISKVLQSSATDGNQWYLNGTEVAGATSTTFEATESGNYTVAANVDECQGETSALVAVAITGLEEEFGVSVFPNPASDKLNVRWNGTADLVLIDAKGSIKLTSSFVDHTEISVSALPVGLYVLKLTSSDTQIVRKFIKE